MLRCCALGKECCSEIINLLKEFLPICGEGRKEETLQAFFAWLGKRRAGRIEVAWVDMWKPYLNAVREHAPQATVAFDRFHLVPHLNRAWYFKKDFQRFFDYMRGAGPRST